jgi:imidazole glycerol phosphate synthase subunit HisF
VEAALAAGVFYREEMSIEAVKGHIREKDRETR